MKTATNAVGACTSEIREVREVMDIRQASRYLGISADSLYRYASEGFIPAFKLGNRWRFRRSRLEEWMDRQSGIDALPEPAPQPKPEPKLVKPRQKKPVRAAASIDSARPRSGRNAARREAVS